MEKNVILCVDDEPIILKSLKKELAGHFAESMLIETAESGDEGLEVIDFLKSRGKNITIIISDYIMPQMRGDRFLIEAHKHLPNAMKILLTGEASIEGVTNVINKIDLYRYISKPWKKADFIMTIESAIEKYNRDKTIKTQRKKITDSINYAERIQSAILPSSDYLNKLLPNHFVFYKPKDIVSGDFYWCREIEGKIIIALADCKGHGVAGAFMSLIGNQLLNRATIEKKIYSPEKILESMNSVIGEVLTSKQKKGESGMEVAVCVIDKEESKVSFAGAKRPICIIENENLIYIEGDKTAIDGKESITYTKQEFDLKPNTQIYLFSDGYQDQLGEKENKPFTSQNLKSLYQTISEVTPKEQLEKLENTFESWKGKEEQIDDVLVLGIKI
ncbi:SpoIIE family protein phosphatase [Bernardetia sp. ABR2-2B]|uniref:SpoIIE family protein phosphatase n=1 Tax=Bernardetia sp. ABR2-2B TaxID=3127472 RepID=UPI0030CEB11C